MEILILIFLNYSYRNNIIMKKPVQGPVRFHTLYENWLIQCVDGRRHESCQQKPVIIGQEFMSYHQVSATVIRRRPFKTLPE